MAQSDHGAAMSKKNGETASVTNRGLPEEMQGILDISTLDTEHYHYRFIQDRPQNIARKRSMGYVNVLAEEEGVKTLTEEVSADGLIRDGDTILMRVPKDRYKARVAKNRAFTEARLSAPEQAFKKKTKGAGPGGTDIPAGEFNHKYDED